jgi:hypothetical protein
MRHFSYSLYPTQPLPADFVGPHLSDNAISSAEHETEHNEDLLPTRIWQLRILRHLSIEVNHPQPAEFFYPSVYSP